MLKEFNLKHPDIHILIVDSSTKESIDLIKSGAVDLSFVTLPIEDSPEIEIIPIMPIHDCFVAGEQYASLINTKMHIFELKFVEKLPVRHIALIQMKNVSLSSAAKEFKKAVLG